MTDKRADFPCPMIGRSHATGPIRSMLDGRTYDSSADLLASYKSHEARTGEKLEIGVDMKELDRRRAEDKATVRAARKKRDRSIMGRALNHITQFGTFDRDRAAKDFAKERERNG